MENEKKLMKVIFLNNEKSIKNKKDYNVFI